MFVVIALSFWFILFQGYRYLYNAYIPWNAATDIVSLFILTVVFIPPALIVSDRFTKYVRRKLKS